MPIVILYNGSDHFCPTCVMSQAEFTEWKLEVLVKLSTAAREVIDDTDTQFVSQEAAAYLVTLDENLKTAQQLLSEDTDPAVAVSAAAEVRRKLVLCL